MPSLLVHDLRTMRGENAVEISAAIRLGDGPDRRLWYRLGGNAPLPEQTDRLDPFVVALLMPAMRRADRLVIDGPVSTSLLAKLEQLRDCWMLWRPGRYRRITIDAPGEVPDRPPAQGAIAAFSGGVDATCTLFRHTHGQAGRNAQAIGAGLLIQGFDIPLGADRAFDVALANATPVLADVDVPLATCRTNWQEIAFDTWRDFDVEWLPGIASCLMQWSGRFGTGLIGSGVDVAAYRPPTAQNPITNGLCSSASFRLVDDGCAITRTRKIGMIANWPIGVRHLRVCLNDAVAGGGNCGYCEKCVRTKLGFVAVGRPVPASLGSATSLIEVATMRVSNARGLAPLRDLLAEARAEGVSGGWRHAVRVAVGLNIARMRFLPFLPDLRKLLGRIGVVRRAYFALRRRTATAITRVAVAQPAITELAAVWH